MFEETLPKTTRHYLDLLAQKDISKPFYLAGGTAVALHLGHRISVDFDFFTPESFDVNYLEDELKTFSEYRRERLAKDTLLGTLEDVRISFFRYRYNLLEPPVSFLGTQILQLPDLAAMKIEAIGQRNVKRDFMDLYFIVHQAGISIENALEYHKAKYTGLDINYGHIILSLGYFDEADDDAMPQMLKPAKWEEVKKYFQFESRLLSQKGFE